MEISAMRVRERERKREKYSSIRQLCKIIIGLIMMTSMLLYTILQSLFSLFFSRSIASFKYNVYKESKTAAADLNHLT